MNGMNNSSDDVVECPLCMEPLEVDDLNFYPCTCGYQICRFCWHRIRTDENELCPACRKEYPENPADFTPLTQEEMIAFKSQKRQRDQQRKQKITENRKHLSNVRVVQRNLVFVVGLPPRLADADVLKKHEYFGKFGKIHKVVINPSTTYAGVQGPSASAYVTYVHNCDALRAIQSVNNIMIDGRLIKTSLGTTKYCSHFMKNQQCPKGDCMYLHELGDPEASFTKEEMHQGKHQEYEKRLHDALIATSGASTASGMGTASNGNGSIVGNGNNSNATSATSNEASATAAATKTTSNHSSHSKNGDCNKLVNGNASSLSSSSVASSGSSSMSTSSTSSTSSSTNSNGSSAAAASGQQPKDAWPSLSESPVNNGVKEAAAANGGHNSAGGKSRREKSKQDRSKHDKNGRNKNRNGGNGGNSGNNHNSNNSLATTNKENQHPHSHSYGTKEAHITTTTTAAGTAIDAGVNEHHNNKTKSEKSRTSHRNSSNQQQQKQQQQKDQQRRRIISADEEVKLIQAADKRRDSSSSSSNRNVADDIAAHCTSSNVIISDEQRSLSTSSSNSSSDNTSTLSESTSGKSSPSSFPESSNNNTDGIVTTTSLTTLEATLEIDSKQQQQTNSLDGGSIDDFSSDLYHNNQQSTLSSNPSSPGVVEHQTTTAIEASEIVAAPSCTMLNMEPLTTNTAATDMQQKLSSAIEQISSNASSSSIIDTTAALSKLNIFDDNNSFFSSATSFQQSLLLKNKLDAELRQNQLNSVISSHLPDLLNGIDGYQNNTANSNEWEEAFKNVMRNNKPIEDQLQHPQQQHQPSSLHHQHQHQQQQQHLQQQEEFLRIQELQKRNNLLNNIGMPQMNGPHNDFPNNFHGATDLSRLSQTALIQHHQQMLQQHQERLQQSTAYSADHLLGNSLFGTNMSKFFDFHKTQQQIHQQQFMVNGHGGGNSGNGGPLSDHLRMASSLENNRINSQFLDKPPNGLLTQQQQQQQQHQLQKQRLLGSKFDPMLPHPQSQQQQQQSQTALQQQQNRIPNQFSHNSSVEDDLGFDPFIETQKALAELMENEMVQQQNTNTSNSGNSSNSTAIPTKLLHQQQQQQQQHQHLSQQQHQQQILDNMQRARMPPPGFNHMNAFGFGVPRAQNSSKILPFMNGGGGSGQPPQQPQMQMQPNSWNPHMQAAAMQQHTLGEPQLHMNSQQNPNSGNHSKGYNSSNDWTAMDPAILSFRQFSSFPQQQQQQQQPPMPHHPQDLYMQHFTQQQQQQQQQNGFGNQSQLHGSVNLQNAATLLNPQNTAAQSLFMNSLTNGFTNNNNFDKFSIPMPPGIHPNNLNKQQKTECIN